MLVTSNSIASPYCGYTERPYMDHSSVRNRLSMSRLAHNPSQTERKTPTSNHEVIALKPATFILVITRSSFASGLTATNEGTDMSFDRQSGLESAFPTGNA